MKEKSDFALVTRPPSAVEKTAPGAKRILSGMIVETLALARKEPPVKRVLHVLTCTGEKLLNEGLQGMIEHHLGREYTVEVTDKWIADEIVDLLKERSFDLILPLINNVSTGTADATHRIAQALDLFADLKAQHGIPVVAFCTDLREMSDFADLPNRAKWAGIDAFFWTPFDVGEFQTVLEACGILPNSPEGKA